MFKVIAVGGNRKPVYVFLLLINSNLGSILHRFGDTVTYWSKNRKFSPSLTHLAPSLGVTPVKFMDMLYEYRN